MTGFTSLGEDMTPNGLVTILNHYLTVVSTLAIDPADGPARVFLGRLDQIAVDLPGADRDGTWVLASK